jgi:LemA protein
MKIFLGILAVLVLAAVVFGMRGVGIRNDLVTKRNVIEGAWAQVDVALQRRADLIPNLVETVKGFAAQEKDILTALANARASMMGAKTPEDRIAANSQVEGALGRLLVVVENYPTLKSDQNFLRLQDELAGTENRIAVERRKYNETVQDYNTSIELFPNNVVASLFNFTRNNAYFKTEPAKRDAPAVKF